MISVNEARKIILEQEFQTQQQIVALDVAVGRVLAKEVLAACDVPQFNNSAMDGYAFDFDGWRGNPLDISGESAAGTPFSGILDLGRAARIFTGAAVPAGADTVVMQEKCSVEGGQLFIQDENIQKGANVRLQASQNKKGDVLLESGFLLTPGAVSFLASCGIAEVEVYVYPKVSIVVTGDEIVMPGTELALGQVYECNSFGLLAALNVLGIAAQIVRVKDDPNLIQEVLKKELETCDLLLVSGGVSVGEYDFVVAALEQCGIEKLFHKVKQKPAKPLFAGRNSCQMVFGLPGNPASVMTSYYVYVLPFLKKLMAVESVHKTAVLANDFKRKSGLTQFLKGKYHNGAVTLLPGQESYRMDGFAQANCLVEIAEDLEFVQAGQSVPLVWFE